MASIYQKTNSSDSTGNIASLELLDNIKQLVKIEREKTKLNYDEFFFNLKRWWCRHYNRPYKDPMLESYTLEELYYEYCDVNYLDEKITEETTETSQEEWDWAEEEEAKEIRERSEKEDVIATENDTIVNESLSDDDWAGKYETKINPTAIEADGGGDISANFES